MFINKIYVSLGILKPQTPKIMEYTAYAVGCGVTLGVIGFILIVLAQKVITHYLKPRS